MGKPGELTILKALSASNCSPAPGTSRAALERFQHAMSRGRYAAALAQSAELARVESSIQPKAAQGLHYGLAAVAHHFLGHHDDAQKHVENFRCLRLAGRLALEMPEVHELRAAVNGVAARIAWLQGKADLAADLAQRALDEARDADHEPALSCALAIGIIPVAWWRGDDSFIPVLIEMLGYDSRHAHRWHYAGRAFELIWEEPDTPLEAIARQDAAALPQSVAMLETLATLDDKYATNTILERNRSPCAGWAASELFRVQGERARREHGADGLDEAEYAYLHAMNRARIEGAPGWGLRAATSLAALWARRGQVEDARVLLGRALDLLTEGYETVDVQAATQLLADIRERHRGTGP